MDQRCETILILCPHIHAVDTFLVSGKLVRPGESLTTRAATVGFERKVGGQDVIAYSLGGLELSGTNMTYAGLLPSATTEH